MDLNPAAKRILCYGDSNTYGRDAKKKALSGLKERLPIGVRWTSLVQRILGDDFEIIEEGLGGRTTDIDHPDYPGCSGLTYLYPCLASHIPLDGVVFMLGTNDLKDEFQRSAHDVAEAVRRMLAVVTTHSPTTKILLISPVAIDGKKPMAAKYSKQGAEKSHQLAQPLQQVAAEHGYAFLDLAAHIKPSQYDGLHIDEKDQETVAALVVEKLREIV